MKAWRLAPCNLPVTMHHIMHHTVPTESTIRHNLGLYRIREFAGRRRELLRLQSWLLDSDVPPVMALTGPAGVGKSTLATATAWSVIRHFPDGVIWVAPAGLERFCLYDIAQTLDTVLGTTITRQSRDMWTTAILELLFRRRRLLILDETDTAPDQEWENLREVFGHLKPRDTDSRVMIVAEKTTPVLTTLAGPRVLALRGFTIRETDVFLKRYDPVHVDSQMSHTLTEGHPLGLMFLQGILLGDTNRGHPGIEDNPVSTESRVRVLARQALADCAHVQPEAYALLVRLTTAAGGAAFTAVRDLFWHGTVTPETKIPHAVPVTRLDHLPMDLQSLLQVLQSRGLLEQDPMNFRVVLHPVIRSLIATSVKIDGMGWRATHARFYVRYATRYGKLDLTHWSEVDREWGNVRQGADWCVQFMHRLTGHEPLALSAELSSQADATLALEAPREKLMLVIRYALALALYAFWRHPPRSLDWIAAGAVACASLADFAGFGHLLLHLGRQQYFRHDFPQALFWLERAHAIFVHRDMPIQLAYVHTDLGMAHRALGHHTQALRHCQSAFEYLAQGSDLAELGNAYLNLGSVHASLQEHDQALRQYRNGLRLASRLDDRRLMANAYNNLGLVLEKRGQHDMAHAVYIRALELYRFLHHGEGESTVLNNLGSVSFLENNATTAENWYRQALACCAARGTWLDMAATHHNLGLVLQRQERWAEAAREFEASLELYRFFQLDTYILEEEALLRQCQEAQTTT